MKTKPIGEKEERCGSCGEPMTDECKRLMAKKCQHRWRQLIETRPAYSYGGGSDYFRFYCLKCLEIKYIYP